MESPQACERKIGSDKKGSTSVNKQTHSTERSVEYDDSLSFSIRMPAGRSKTPAPPNENYAVAGDVFVRHHIAASADLVNADFA